MKVLPSTDEFSEDTSPAEVSVAPEQSRAGPGQMSSRHLRRPHILLPFVHLLCSPFPAQFVQEGAKENDTVLHFDSPAVNCSCDIQSLRTFLHLDNVVEELRSFVYHPEPTFDKLQKNVITETSIIIVTVRTTPGVAPPVPRPSDPLRPFRATVSTRP